MSDISFQYPSDRDRYINRPADTESRLTRLERLLSRVAPWHAGRPIFSSVSSRDQAGIPKTLGQLCYVQSNDTEYKWNGTSWLIWNTPVTGLDSLSWTPTTIDITVGNGSLVCKYRVNSGEVKFNIVWTFGSTSSWSGASPRISLPFHFSNVSPAFDDRPSIQTGIHVTFYDDAGGSGRNFGKGYASGTNLVGILANYAVPGAGAITGVAPTNSFPHSWTTNDIAFVEGRYIAYQ